MKCLPTNGWDVRNVFALGALNRTEHEHGGDGRDHEARDYGGDRADLDHGDTDEHADDIGDEPGDPHGGAQAMEGAFTLEGSRAAALALEVDEHRPTGMEEHEQDRGEPGDAVDRGGGLGAGAGHDGHHGGAGGVTGQAEPEQDDVGPMQASVGPLFEDADGVKDKCACDGEAGEHEHGGHASFLSTCKTCVVHI